MNKQLKTCIECGHSYYKESSAMAELCPECAHKLYGYPKCNHEFADGRCTKCGWHGVPEKSGN